MNILSKFPIIEASMFKQKIFIIVNFLLQSYNGEFYKKNVWNILKTFRKIILTRNSWIRLYSM